MRVHWRILLWIAWLAAAVWGGFGFVERLSGGHAAANYGSYIVWGLWVSAYIYFVGISAGSFLLSSLIYVFGERRFERVGRLALFTAIISLCMALFSIWCDLGQMSRVHRIFTSPNFGSMMAWMVWLYSFYLLLMLIELWLATRADLARWQASARGARRVIGRLLACSRGPLDARQERRCRHWLKVLVLTGIPLAIAFSGGVGALFSTLSARAFWHTPLMPILFLTGALVSGVGLVAFLAALFAPRRPAEQRDTVLLLGRALLALLIFDVILEWAEFSVPMWYGVGPEYSLLMRVLFGEFWWVFWVLHVGLGCIVPILLLALRWRAWSVGLAGLLVAVTFMTVRLNIVIPGLLDPHFQGLQTAFTDHRLVFWYVPSLFEWQVTVFIVALGAALFYLGFRLLPLAPHDEGAAGCQA